MRPRSRGLQAALVTGDVRRPPCASPVRLIARRRVLAPRQKCSAQPSRIASDATNSGFGRLWVARLATSGPHQPCGGLSEQAKRVAPAPEGGRRFWLELSSWQARGLCLPGDPGYASHHVGGHTQRCAFDPERPGAAAAGGPCWRLRHESGGKSCTDERRYANL